LLLAGDWLASGGDRQRGDDGDPRDEHDDGVTGHQTSPPAGDDRVVVLVVRRAGTTRGQPGPREAEQRRQESDRDQHGDRGGDAHGPEERDPDDGQPGRRDDHGDPREDHGAAGRADRASHGVERGVALREERAVPRQDEQRVVDADREPEHEGQSQGRGGHVGERRHAEDPGCADGHAEERGDDRHAGREERAQRHHENDEGSKQPDGLGAGHDLERRVERSAADGGAPAAVLSGVDHGLEAGDGG
jgi:hypothetical protein